MTTSRTKDSPVDGSREQTRKAQLAEDRGVTRALQSKYSSWATRHPTVTQDFVDAIKEVLPGASLAFNSIMARVRFFRSLRQKALRREADGSYVYPDPWHNIHDITGVRVTMHHSTEISVITDAPGDSLTVLCMIDKTAGTRVSDRLRYGSRHLIYKMSMAAPPELAPCADMQFEVQLHIVPQRTWAEFEHDIRYKAPEGAADPWIDRAFALAAGLIKPANQQFGQVVTVLEEPMPDDSVQGEGGKPLVPAETTADDVVMTEETLSGVLTMSLPDTPRSGLKYYDQAEELLEHNGTRTVGQLWELFNPQHLNAVSKVMKYHSDPGHVHVIGDLLLAVRGEKHIKITADTNHNPKHRPARSCTRLQQLAGVGIPVSDVPEDDRADGDHVSQTARYRDRTPASMRESPSEAMAESGRYSAIWPPELRPVPSSS